MNLKPGNYDDRFEVIFSQQSLNTINHKQIDIIEICLIENGFHTLNLSRFKPIHPTMFGSVKLAFINQKSSFNLSLLESTLH